MSCLENEVIYENCLEDFWELMNNYDFQCLIGEHFLSAQEQLEEKEYGFNEEPYNNAFDILWDWDCEGLARDILSCVKRYIKKVKREGRLWVITKKLQINCLTIT
jgi:hypothetical protein